MLGRRSHRSSTEVEPGCDPPDSLERTMPRGTTSRRRVPRRSPAGGRLHYTKYAGFSTVAFSWVNRGSVSRPGVGLWPPGDHDGRITPGYEPEGSIPAAKAAVPAQFDLGSSCTHRSCPFAARRRMDTLRAPRQPVALSGLDFAKIKGECGLVTGRSLPGTLVGDIVLYLPQR